MMRLLLGLICGGCILVYAYVFMRGRLHRKFPFKEAAIAPFRLLLNRRGMFDRLQLHLMRQRAALAALNDGECDREALLDWTAECAGLACAAALTAGLAAAAADNAGLLGVGLAAAAGFPALRSRDLLGRAERRKLAIALELPELLNRLLLAVDAGENVMRALERSAEHEREPAHPLYAELRGALRALKRGESLSDALEEMGRRCASPEVRVFATTLLIHARRGGEAFVPALRELTRTMWEKRKAIARTLGEQASARMTFPLAAAFLLIMALVAAPAMLMM